MPVSTDRDSRLPALYPITPAWVAPDQRGGLVRCIEAELRSGVGLLRIRLPLWAGDLVRDLASELSASVEAACARITLDADIPGAQALGGGFGVHLAARQLAGLDERPLPPGRLVGASCHSEQELEHALRLGADFVTLSPVAPTASHPDAEPLGWNRFRQLIAGYPLPVYALGGMTPDQLTEARRYGAHGVAGIRAFWRSTVE
ncbi:thiamine phosphate synthase [Nocardia terpenica]|uniref:Thiamine phosphate synthase/TenI domain-containing protein n=1 Tax=Nocardia terpenica TaxID=455432 RepID=A0A164LQZ9_9NOCA|nr:thiamine phosphate synthase [Nocardia terpenica]KZM72672.1 hypothetical protein AWN90_28220 [Nocardia terpenica]NQE92429.1 thiamine phosphate synthase [Nocardia terpenica]